MKLRAALAAAMTAAGVLAAAPALAANANVTITRAGFVPESVTVKTGESVTFTNTDTIGHQVVPQKTTGVTCTPNPLVLQPTQTGTCSFAAAGTFAYRDPTQRGSFKGTVVVQAAPASVTLAASTNTVVYGGKVTLAGNLSAAAANEKATIEAQPCGESAQRLATVTTTSGGAYSYAAQPLKITTYTARSKAAASASVTVKVRPRLRLGKVAPKRYAVRVFAAQSFAGHVAAFQRYNRLRRAWVTVRRVILRPGTGAVAPTVISSATFSARVRSGLRVRIVLPQAQVGGCYLAGRSNIVFS